MIKTEIVPRQGRLLLHGSVENQYDLGEITLEPGSAILLKFDTDTPKWNAHQFQEKSYNECFRRTGRVPGRNYSFSSANSFITSINQEFGGEQLSSIVI